MYYKIKTKKAIMRLFNLTNLKENIIRIFGKIFGAEISAHQAPQTRK